MLVERTGPRDAISILRCRLNGKMAAGRQRMRLRITGAVQGVGFRPFVHRLARRYDLSGFVLNDASGVLIEVEGTSLSAFFSALRRERPPLARVDSFETQALAPAGGRHFEIRESRAGRRGTRPTPDAATCDACHAELFDPASRFYHYPFVTCTDCGPRFTIMHALPYDRQRTSLSTFPLCMACTRDYEDPNGRRFHAEAIACPDCGPQLSHAVKTIAASLASGAIVALKGVGGFHLICDAWNAAAVGELRRRKMRAAKPFAVMLENEDDIEVVAAPTQLEREVLRRGERPIVLLRSRQVLAPSVAPGLTQLGVMLPYAPVHHLLFRALLELDRAKSRQEAARPVALVMTSANAGGEPLVTDNAEARRRLVGLADLIVTHNRDIVVPADDSVAAVVNGTPTYIRRGRGAIPEPIDLGGDGPAVLALGGLLKSTVTVTRGREAFISQPIGDLNRAATIRVHEETVRHLLEMLDVNPAVVACDLHPDFPSTRLAASTGLPVIAIQHHAAHVAAVVAEHQHSGPVVGVALDGQGLGSDGSAWGGELLRLEGPSWRRLGHLYPLALPGGDLAAREPWRMGVAALVALGRAADAAAYFADQPRASQLARMIVQGGVVGTTSSMGRLFDAATALIGLCMHQSYEGEAAMLLESHVCVPTILADGFVVRSGVLDFRPLLSALMAHRGDYRVGADLFHGTVIAGLAAWIGGAAVEAGLTTVALGGGCFMNRHLTQGLVASLHALGLSVLLPRLVPANDGGLSFGQACLARLSVIESRSHGSRSERDLSCVSPFPSA